ncbi:MAG TPA: glycosyltransferase [bacterium]|nr:glycosyltransferase [bacterium]
MLSFSIVVPTYNRANQLVPTLNSLLRQNTACDFEVVVVDNNSSDSTPAAVRSVDKVRYVFEGRQGLAYARNTGIAHSTGEIIVFVDDDATAAPNWLEELHKVYARFPDAWCVGGKIVLDLPDNLPRWFDPSVTGYLSELDLGEEIVRVGYPGELYGTNFSVARSAIARVGAFLPRLGRRGSLLRSGEDTEMCWRIQRAGGGVFYNGRAVVVHRVPSSRLERRFFRNRAYWEGRTVFLLGVRRRPTVISSALLVAKNKMRVLRRRPAPEGRRFAAELAFWYELGYLHQSLTPQ